MSANTEPGKQQRKHGIVAMALAGFVAGMVGLSFAAVPLYRMFCQATGYDGTPLRAEKGADHVLDRTIRIRFDGNVASGLPWTFKPEQQTIDVKIGETALAFFKAVNTANTAVAGNATFNVSPERAAAYFAKIECFCFSEQTLKAGETVDMPVTFFVDPKIVDDDDTKNISEITLSYTFYRSAKEPGVAAVPEGGKS